MKVKLEFRMQKSEVRSKIEEEGDSSTLVGVTVTGTARMNPAPYRKRVLQRPGRGWLADERSLRSNFVVDSSQ